MGKPWRPPWVEHPTPDQIRAYIKLHASNILHNGMTLSQLCEKERKQFLADCITRKHFPPRVYQFDEV
jgi:hypothetical protein